MNPIFISLTLALVIAQLALPKKLGFLPLIFAACHMGSIEILPELTVARILILLGLLRAISGGFFVWPGKVKLDKVFFAFSFFLLLSTVGHTPDAYLPSPFLARCGMVLNALGAYLYARIYLPDVGSFRSYCRWLPIFLIPLAAVMALQKATARNYYSLIGVTTDWSAVREDKVRAQGPFKHAILAGCAGATALPFALILWRSKQRMLALIAAGTYMTIVISSASSGPLAAVGVSLGGFLLWRWRQHMRYLLWAMICFAVLYTVIKGRGPWYIMAGLDLVGGSTGWHRAKLMDQGYVYLNEWWLWGTDYTRHWMSSGTRVNPNMVDLTNYYLNLGVVGGLPVMLSLMALIAVGIKMLSRRMKELRAVGSADEMVLWFVGASLAAHAISFVAISYFDQMYIFFYVLLGAIPGLCSSPIEEASSNHEWQAEERPYIPHYAEG